MLHVLRRIRDSQGWQDLTPRRGKSLLIGEEWGRGRAQWSCRCSGHGAGDEKSLMWGEAEIGDSGQDSTLELNLHTHIHIPPPSPTYNSQHLLPLL